MLSSNKNSVKTYIFLLLTIFCPARALAFDLPPNLYYVEVNGYDFQSMVSDDAAGRAWNALAQNINPVFVENGSFVHAVFRDGWKQVYVVSDRMSTLALTPSGEPIAPHGSSDNGSTGGGSSGGGSASGGSSGGGSAGGGGSWGGGSNPSEPSYPSPRPLPPGMGNGDGCIIEVPGQGRETQYIRCNP